MNKNEYAKKLLDPRWQKMRLEVFQRDSFTCQSCGCSDKTLHAHHSYYDKSVVEPWDYPHGSIVTLCDDCHKAEHEFFFANKDSLIQAICGAGFSTADRQGELLSYMSLLSGMSGDDRSRFMLMIGEFIANRAIRLGLPYGNSMREAIHIALDGDRNA